MYRQGITYRTPITFTDSSLRLVYTLPAAHLAVSHGIILVVCHIQVALHTSRAMLALIYSDVDSIDNSTVLAPQANINVFSHISHEHDIR